MTTPTLGRLITSHEGRDAVHVAVAPTTAPCELRPGQHVDAQGNPEGGGTTPVGIVDPFLREAVQPGQRFWLFLYPNTVTSLRHDWEHPAFPATSSADVNRVIKEYLDRKKARSE